ncbi:MAG: ABC transporter permease [Thermoplasmataceae archaeon]
MELRYYIIRRLLIFIPTLIGLLLIVFILMHSLPVRYLTGPYVTGRTPAQRALEYAQAVQALGLNYPLPVQFLDFIRNIFTGNWGYMSAGGGYTGSVLALVDTYFPNTVQLAVFAIILAFVISIPLGTYIGARPNSMADQVGRVFSLIFYALPGFLFAIILLVIFGKNTIGGLPWQVFPLSGVYPSSVTTNVPSWFHLSQATGDISYPTHIFVLDALLNGDPAAAWGGFLHLVLPSIALALGALAGILRFLRAGMVDAANQEYVKTARAKGVPEDIVIKRHIRKNALIPTVTVLGLLFSGLLSGVVLIERVFSYQGIGLLAYYSVYPSLQVYGIADTALIFGLLLVFANLIVDVVYALIDPRIRY